MRWTVLEPSDETRGFRDAARARTVAEWQAAMSAQLAQARQLGGLVIPRSFVLLGRVLASVAGLLATYKPRLELHPLIARHLAAAIA